MDNVTLFNAVVRALDGWTALKLSVEHGMAGVNGLASARRMPEEIMGFFANNRAEIEYEDLSAFLSVLMYERFHTDCQDGSLDAVAYTLASLYNSLAEGNEFMFRKVLDSVPQACTWLFNLEIQELPPVVLPRRHIVIRPFVGYPAEDANEVQDVPGPGNAAQEANEMQGNAGLGNAAQGANEMEGNAGLGNAAQGANEMQRNAGLGNAAQGANEMQRNAGLGNAAQGANEMQDVAVPGTSRQGTDSAQPAWGPFVPQGAIPPPDAFVAQGPFAQAGVVPPGPFVMQTAYPSGSLSQAGDILRRQLADPAQNVAQANSGKSRSFAPGFGAGNGDFIVTEEMKMDEDDDDDSGWVDVVKKRRRH